MRAHPLTTAALLVILALPALAHAQASAVPDPVGALALVSGACAALSGAVVVLWRQNVKLHRQLVEFWRERDAQREVAVKERDAQREQELALWRESVDHMEAIRDAVTRRGIP